MDQVAKLHETIAELRERILYLEGLLRVDRLPSCLGITPTEGKILSVLMRREMATKAQLMEVVYGDRAGDCPDEQILNVYVCRMRPVLARRGIVIHTIRAVGYSMPRVCKAVIHALLTDVTGDQALDPHPNKESTDESHRAAAAAG